MNKSQSVDEPVESLPPARPPSPYLTDKEFPSKRIDDFAPEAPGLQLVEENSLRREGGREEGREGIAE